MPTKGRTPSSTIRSKQGCSCSTVVWSFGDGNTTAGNTSIIGRTPNMPGNGANQLNWPYDAKLVNDFTGLTPPL